MEYISIVNDGSIVFLTINRPRELNALNTDVLHEFEYILGNIDYDKSRCLIIQGSGDKAFVAGADIVEMANMSRTEARRFSEYGNKVFSMLANISIPTVALVRGYVLGGGCELAMACDIRIASDTAVFGQPETGLGIIPGFGGTQRLSRIVGLPKAKEIIFSGNRIKANEALKIGLVNQVYPDSKILDRTVELAKKISLNAPIAIRCAKEAINKGYDLSIDNALQLESDYFSRTFETQDQIEGMCAFVEKRRHNPYINR